MLAGWSFWLLIIITYHYLGFWEYQAYDFIKVAPMVLFLAAPVMMVLLTFVLTPELRYFQKMDLEEHYFQTKNWFFCMVIIFLVLSRASDPLLPDFAETWPGRSVGTLLITMSIIWLLFTSNRQVHYALLLFNLVYLILVASLVPVTGMTAF